MPSAGETLTSLLFSPVSAVDTTAGFLSDDEIILILLGVCTVACADMRTCFCSAVAIRLTSTPASARNKDRGVGGTVT